MEFLEVIKARHSIRVYTGRSIEPEKLQAILEAASLAPSAGNLQAYEIYTVTSRTCLSELAHAALDQEFIAQAPLALVFCAHPARSAKEYADRGRSLYSVQDATIACAYAQLAATVLGLASVWVGAFDESQARKAIGAGFELLPVAVLPIGYAGERPTATLRRPTQDLVHYVV